MSYVILRHKSILKNPAIFENDVNHEKFAVNAKILVIYAGIQN